MKRLGCIPKKVNAKTVVASAFVLLATGFLFAAGYDIYARVFKKPA